MNQIQENFQQSHQLAQRSSNFDVFSIAMEQYAKTTTHKAFRYVQPWIALKDAPK